VCAERELWFPQPQSLLAVGLERWRRGERDDPFAVEPLYLRPSSAEEKWKELGRA
jgi:tRNA A37 threonylcarbamoyladenosine modification protein TsaB